MVKVLFFASLRENIDCDQITIDIATPTSIASVKAHIIDRNPQWRQHFDNKSLLNACNSAMVNEQHTVQAGDEVAFFPPVTGG